MDHQRQSGFARRLNVRPQALLLRGARAVVVVIIEPGFADRHHFRMLGDRHQLGRADVELFMRLVWMRADRAEHVREFLGDGQHLGMPAHARADRHHASDVSRAGARHHRVELGGEIREIQVAVAVHQHFQLLASGST